MRSSIQKTCRRWAAVIIVPLALSGCVSGFYHSATSFLWPEKSHDAASADPSAPAGDGPAQQVVSSREATVTPHTLPDADVKPGTTGVAGPSPGPAMPATPSAPPEPPKPENGPAAHSRRLAAARPPDSSYGEALLTEDVAWRGEVLVTGVVTVAPQATLTIMPGTVVRFGGNDHTAAGAALLVLGRVAAIGTKEQPIVLTSGFSEAAKGDWQGIIVLGSEKKNVFEQCVLEGAEIGLDASFSAITLKNVIFTRNVTGARLQDTIISAAGGGADGCTTGMTLAGSEADLSNVAFSGNSRGLVMQTSSLYMAGGVFAGNADAGFQAADSRLMIAGGGFTANGAGIAIVSSQGSVSGCRIAENVDYGISLSGSRVKVYGNEIVKNGTVGLKVEGGTGAAWSNSFAGNGSYDLLNAGTEDFMAVGNWWGEAGRGEIGRRIYDRQANGKRGRVMYLPAMTAKPAPNP